MDKKNRPKEKPLQPFLFSLTLAELCVLYAQRPADVGVRHLRALLVLSAEREVELLAMEPERKHCMCITQPFHIFLTWAPGTSRTRTP